MEGEGREGAEVGRINGGPGVSRGFESRLASPHWYLSPLGCLLRPSAWETPRTPLLPEGRAVSPQLNVSFPSLVRLRKLRPTKVGRLARAQLWGAQRLTGRSCGDLSTCCKAKQNKTKHKTQVRRSCSPVTLGLLRCRPAQANDWERATVWDLSGLGLREGNLVSCGPASVSARPLASPCLSFPSAQRRDSWRADPAHHHTHDFQRGVGHRPGARVCESTRPRLALTSALTPPAPLATGSGHSAGLTLRLLPAARRPSRSFPYPLPEEGPGWGWGGTTRGRSWAGPAALQGGRSRPASRPWPARFPSPGMRLPPWSKSVFTATSLAPARP